MLYSNGLFDQMADPVLHVHFFPLCTTVVCMLLCDQNICLCSMTKEDGQVREGVENGACASCDMNPERFIKLQCNG